MYRNTYRLWTLTALVALSVIPLSFYLETGQLNFVNLVTGPNVFQLQYVSVTLSHIALVIASIIILPVFFKHAMLSNADWGVLIIGVLMTTSLLAGIVTTADSVSILNYCKSMLIVPLYFIGRSISSSILPRIVITIIVSNFVFLLAVFLFGIVSGLYSPLSPLSYARVVSSSIFEFRNLFPVVAYASFMLSIIALGYQQTNLLKSVMVGNIILVLWMITISWSRTSLLIFIQCIVLFSIVSLSIRARRRDVDARVIKCMTGLLIAVLLVSFVLLLSGNILANIAIFERVENSSGEDVSNRLYQLTEGLKRLAESPLFGEMYIPTVLDNRLGEVFDHPRLFKPHNQYVDFGLRGGALAMLLLITFHVGFTFQVLRKALSMKQPFVRSLLLFLFAFSASLFLGNFGQNYLVQSSSAFLIWLLMGAGVSLLERSAARLNQRVTRSPTAQHA